MWHMCGTVKMGKPDESETCVDKDFKVLGVEGLRVVDMSVAPLIPWSVLFHSFPSFPFPLVPFLPFLVSYSLHPHSANIQLLSSIITAHTPKQ